MRRQNWRVGCNRFAHGSADGTVPSSGWALEPGFRVPIALACFRDEHRAHLSSAIN